MENDSMYTLRQSDKITAFPSLLALTLGVFVGIAGLCWAETSTPSKVRAVSCTSEYKNKAVPAKKLRAIVLSHGQWLEERYDQHYHRANLCGADLHGAALNGANLERANLEEANLRRANLYQSSLAHARLAGADFSSASLEDGKLSGADMRAARLSGANLFRVIGDEAALINSAMVRAQ